MVWIQLLVCFQPVLQLGLDESFCFSLLMLLRGEIGRYELVSDGGLPFFGMATISAALHDAGVSALVQDLLISFSRERSAVGASCFSRSLGMPSGPGLFRFFFFIFLRAAFSSAGEKGAHMPVFSP